MTRRPVTGRTGAVDARTSRASNQRRRRRRRFVRGFTRVIFWTLVLGAVFIFGLGLGRTISRDEGGANAPKVTVEHDKGTVTATLPTTTITTVQTVTVSRKTKASTKKSTANQ